MTHIVACFPAVSCTYMGFGAACASINGPRTLHLRFPDFGWQDDVPTAWIYALDAFLAFGLLASGTICSTIFGICTQIGNIGRGNTAPRERRIADCLERWTYGDLRAWLLGLAVAAGMGCVAMLALYLVLSLSYSFRLKREPIVDVFLLALAFTMRLALGVVVTGVDNRHGSSSFRCLFPLAVIGEAANRNHPHGGT